MRGQDMGSDRTSRQVTLVIGGLLLTVGILSWWSLPRAPRLVVPDPLRTVPTGVERLAPAPARLSDRIIAPHGADEDFRDGLGVTLCGWFDDFGPPKNSPTGVAHVGAEAIVVPTAAPLPTPPVRPSLAACPPLCGPNAGRCQVCAPPRTVTGVDSATCVPCGEPTWSLRGPLPWEVFAQGEYVGPHRWPHVPDYRLRIDDTIEFVYRLTRERSGRPYELSVGDRVQIESIADADLNRELEVQPDGTLVLPLIGEVMGSGRTADQVRLDLEQRYKKYYKDPTITVTPTRVNQRVEDLRATVDNRSGVVGGQGIQTRVNPEGSVSLPALGPIRVHGLTLIELQQEINARYDAQFDGIEVIPVLRERAPRYIYVVGEVRQPGRFELVGPTTVTQSIALAQGWNIGANLRHIVIFRRANDWRLLATRVDLRALCTVSVPPRPMNCGSEIPMW